jgi:hypothetical protein
VLRLCYGSILGGDWEGAEVGWSGGTSLCQRLGILAEARKKKIKMRAITARKPPILNQGDIGWEL